MLEDTGDPEEVVSVMGQVLNCQSARHCVYECGVAYASALTRMKDELDLC